MLLMLSTMLKLLLMNKINRLPNLRNRQTKMVNWVAVT
jgi:hypothetical protein